MILAEKVPSAMIFLRTPGGISHDPAESVVEDVEKAFVCGLYLLDATGFLPRIQRTNTCIILVEREAHNNPTICY